MVIGLNGRIPLNTAGNLAGATATAAARPTAHLGNSPSEIDPTYGAAERVRRRTTADHPSRRQLRPPDRSFNTQVDNAGDVRQPSSDICRSRPHLTQLRNIGVASTWPTDPNWSYQRRSTTSCAEQRQSYCSCPTASRIRADIVAYRPQSAPRPWSGA